MPAIFVTSVVLCLLAGSMLAVAAAMTAWETLSLSVSRLGDSPPIAGSASAARRVRRVFGLLRDTRAVLTGSLVGNLVCLLLAAGFLKTAIRLIVLAIREGGGGSPTIEWLASSSLWTFLVLTPCYMLFAVLLPQRWCRSNPESALRACGHPGLVWLRWWFPLAERLVSPIAGGLRRMGLDGGFDPARLTREDLRAIVEEEEPTSVEQPESWPGSQRRMIRSILSMHRTLVREIMRPIGEVVAIRLGDMTPAQVVSFARQHHHTRFPVYRERMIDLIGHINIYDLLGEELEGRSLDEFLRETIFVPETARVDTLLHEFLRHKAACAIVFDEHGSCSGWVTREDVLEVIVGDLEAEGDPARRLIVEGPAGAYIVDPRIDVDDLSRLLGVGIEKLHCETVRGYVHDVLGRVAVPGDRLFLPGWTLEVAEMDRHIIRSLRLFPRSTVSKEPNGSDSATQ